MFSAILFKQPKFFNEGLRKYCLQSTNGYIKTIVENYDTERNTKLNYLTTNDGTIVPIISPCAPDLNSNANFLIKTFCFLSIVSVMHFFYKSKK